MGIINKLYNWVSGVIPVSEMNAEFNQVINTINGNIGSENIAGYTITNDNLNASVSPGTRWAESFQNYVASGLTVTAAGLSCTVASGTAYVSGERLVVASTGYTVPDGATTFCDLSSSGTFNWNSNPSPPANHLRLARIVAAGGTCTITDMRTRTPIGAQQIEAKNVWDVASTNATGSTTTTSVTRATLLSTALTNVKAGDTVFLFGMAQLSASAALSANLGFQAGGANTTMEPEEDIETAAKDKAISVLDVYAVVADAASLTINFTWRTSTGTLTAFHRTLVAVRFRPTGI